MPTLWYNNNNYYQSNPREVPNFSCPLPPNQQQERPTGNTQQPQAQIYDDYHNPSKGTNKTTYYQAIELRPMQKRSSCNRPLSELPRRPSQQGSNSDKPPPDLDKPLPDLPPEAFKHPSAATSAKTEESLTHQAETSDNALGNRVPRQAIPERSQYRGSQAQGGDNPAQNLQQLRGKGCEEEGATKSRVDLQMAARDVKERQRVKWLEGQ